MGTKKTVAVTGSAGFIGFHLSKKLLANGFQVVGIDNLNTYYDVNLKKARLSELESQNDFRFCQVDIADSRGLRNVFESESISLVVNLAAQAGVRYSLENPQAYINANVTGFVNVLECCRHFGIEHLVFASSSSVYGANTLQPFSVQHNVDHPISLYAATKKSNELLAHSYSSNFGLSVTGLRFFTVYGPWGRPDMALFLFTDAILKNKSIDVFNNGEMSRDFTYIDDIVEGVYRVLLKPAKSDPNWDSNHPDPSSSFAPYRLCNIGSQNPISLLAFIETIEEMTGKKAEKNYLPMQLGDVPSTFADITNLKEITEFIPRTPLVTGIRNFVSWYRDYYQV